MSSGEQGCHERRIVGDRFLSLRHLRDFVRQTTIRREIAGFGSLVVPNARQWPRHNKNLITL
jgi:hypothetical protein